MGTARTVNSDGDGPASSRRCRLREIAALRLSFKVRFNQSTIGGLAGTPKQERELHRNVRASQGLLDDGTGQPTDSRFQSGELLPPQACRLAAPSERHEPQLPHLVEEPPIRGQSRRRRSDVQNPKGVSLTIGPIEESEQ
jgi:hypothetical protein